MEIFSETGKVFFPWQQDVMDESVAELTMEALKERNHCFYQDILPENYESSYGNPAYAVQQMGEYGKASVFCMQRSQEL